VAGEGFQVPQEGIIQVLQGLFGVVDVALKARAAPHVSRNGREALAGFKHKYAAHQSQAKVTDGV
jgi:hypothetical protein